VLPVDEDVSPCAESPPLSPARPRRLIRDEHFDSDDEDFELAHKQSLEADIPLVYDGDLEEPPEDRGELLTTEAGAKKKKMTKADLSEMVPDNIVSPWPVLNV